MLKLPENDALYIVWDPSLWPNVWNGLQREKNQTYSAENCISHDVALLYDSILCQ